MALIVPNDSEILLLQYIVNSTNTDGTAPTATVATYSSGNRVLHLFTNNLTPAETTTIGAVTEATASGYASITLLGTAWSIGTDGGGVTTASYSEVTFTFTTAVTCYGYYITTSASYSGGVKLLWLERFTGAPFQLPSGGGQIAITPKVSLE
jgi:hypothetical protein